MHSRNDLTATPPGGLDRAALLNLADAALHLAARAGAQYADIRIGRNEREFLFAREDKLQALDYSVDTGFGLRVLVNGSWGFAGSTTLSSQELSRMVTLAMENAAASATIQATPISLEDIPAAQADWVMPMKTDPFAVPADEKAALLLAVNAAALKSGADFCNACLTFLREYKLFASSRGSVITQTRLRCHPEFSAMAVDKETGKFARRNSLAAPRGAGWDYVLACDLVSEAALAGEQVREKLAARPVEPGRYDLVIDPTNLWLTIHESVGHSTELDRALGWEADFAGTSFVTPDKLGTLQFGSPLMTVMADRSQEGGLSTIAYDDDGVAASDAEFPIVEKGVFKNFQMAIGQAGYIGQQRSNGCAFADRPTAFPIQRMPNISLMPNPDPCSLDDLIGGIDNGIYILGEGSWSIDQQRDNFQFGGQLFYEIKGGKLGPMLRDVAYQSRTLEFWNALDGLGDKSTYFLGGAFFCGKAQPIQVAPVSHGAVPSRFRNITVLNTERGDV